MKKHSLSLKAKCPFCGEGILHVEYLGNDSSYIKCSFCEEYEIEL